MGRLTEGDHTILSGVTKFIRTYDALKQSHSPTPAIAYALHNFGRPDSKLNEHCSYMHVYLSLQ